MECPSCRAEVREGSKFCDECGAPVPVRCPACGSDNRPGAKFCSECGTKLSRAGEPGSPPASAPTSSAERRQLTVMFCDLVGSTALAAGMDPEDLREVIGAYHRCVAETVGRFDGFVAKYLGDGVLAYFGYPRAHEDAAERAVRAGLALVQAIGGLRPRADVALWVRVGIATGLVVVGDLVGEGAAREEAVVGETPNLAARLQALAAPGAVVISQVTRRLVGGLFELDDLGPRRLKGFAEPLRAWRVLGPSAAEGRFAARQTTGLTPLVGRGEEIALLMRRWEQAKDGEGQVVLLAGEPGIGKSRVVREVRERLAGEPHLRLSYQCSPYHQTSPLHPVIAQLERAAGWARDEPPEQRLDKLERLLARGTGRPDEAVPLLAALLAVPTGGRYPPLDLTPQRQKRRTLEVLVDQLEGLAAEQPVLVVYEDLHWVDPTTRELLDLAVERVQRLPVLLLMTFRPEFKPPWAGLPHVSTLALTRLGRRQGAALVERVAGGKALPGEVLDQIVAKTDGVPLFVEELTKTVLDSGLLREEGAHYVLAGPLPPLAIPATLQDSLMARLDRPVPVKEVAQIGAAIGREFSHELLVAVAPLDDDALRDALDQLVEAELVFRRGTPPQTTYSFKHALVQDVAYGTLLKSRRQRLHARIARVLEERFPEQAEAQPELLAHHCVQAGLVERAIAYRYKAGRQAIARSAMAEAVAQLTQALELLAGLPAGPDRDRQELDLQVALGGALTMAKGWGSPEMGKAYARARELCHAAGEDAARFPALFGLFLFHLNRSELAAAHEVAEEFLHLTERQNDTAIKLLGHRVIGTSLLFLARLGEALPHFERVVAGYDPPTHHPRRLTNYGAADSRVASRSFSAWILLYQGRPDQALAQSRRALADARELGHPYTSAFALHLSCLFHQARGDRTLVGERSATLIALAAEQGFPHLLATGTFFHGWALATGDTTEAGIKEMRRGLAAKRAGGAEIKVPYYLGLLANAHANIGQQAEAVSLLAEALGQVERTDERWSEAELHRIRGEVLLGARLPDADEAEACFVRAIDVAQTQRAKWWELRATMGLARLWRDRGRCDEARPLLAAIYGWFTEGFGTPDLRATKALLDELRE